MESLCMKFHDDICKGKAIMRHNHFRQSMHCDLDLCTQKSLGYIHHSSGVCAWSFMMIGGKGKQLCDWTISPNQASTDGSTDRLIPVYHTLPLSFQHTDVNLCSHSNLVNHWWNHVAVGNKLRVSCIWRHCWLSYGAYTKWQNSTCIGYMYKVPWLITHSRFTTMFSVTVRN